MAISLPTSRRPPLHVLLFCLAFGLILISFSVFRDPIVTFQNSNTTSSYLLPENVSPDDPVRACFVVLVRNQELNGLLSSMRQLEDTFNHKFNYPYVFLNDDEFTTEFMELTAAATSAQVKYGKVDAQMWGYPSFINQTLAAQNREEMAATGLPYGGSESYRHMCRCEIDCTPQKIALSFTNYFPASGSRAAISLDTLCWMNMTTTGASNPM
jgi:alpha 1,2-mannosyltransferase